MTGSGEADHATAARLLAELEQRERQRIAVELWLQALATGDALPAVKP